MSKRQRRWLASVWAWAIVAQAVGAAATKAEEPDDIFFHDDYNKAIREARLTQKPIFLEFRCAP